MQRKSRYELQCESHHFGRDTAIGVFVKLCFGSAMTLIPQTVVK